MIKYSDIRNSLDKKGLHFCLQEASKRIFRLRWIPDKKIMDLVFERRAYSYLERKYVPLLQNFVRDGSDTDTYKPRIWVCWLQGEQNAPELVKVCLKSIRDNANGMEVVLITNDNLEEYVHIPAFISNGLKRKRMQYAQYSDYIRIALLARHGGIWIDSTVLLTSPIPSFITEQPLFCFQASPLSPSISLLSSWFIAAVPGNPLVSKVKYLIEEYWKRESKLCDYFLFHLVFSAIVNHDAESGKIWKEMPYINNGDCHLLQKNLFEKFNAEQYAHICDLSFAHKLTYKFKKNANITDADTFLRHILSIQSK